MTAAWQGFRKWPRWAQWTTWIVLGCFAAGLLAGSPQKDTTSTESSVSASVKAKPVKSAPVEISAADLVDFMGGEAKFCHGYATILASGLGEDVAYGNFLKGFTASGAANQPGAPSGRDVFDELKSRC